MQPPNRHQDRPPFPGTGHVENYTTPFLIVAGVLCYIALLTLWIVFGLPLVLIGADFADRVIARC